MAGSSPATTFLTMLATAGAVGAPGVMIVPFQREFGWQNADISSALAIRLLLFGLMGPFAAAFMNRFGIKRVVSCGAAVHHGRARGLAGDDRGVAAHPAVGDRRRPRHRDDRPGAGGDRGDALVRLIGAAWSSACSRPAPPPGSWSSCRCWPSSPSGSAGGSRCAWCSARC